MSGVEHRCFQCGELVSAGSPMGLCVPCLLESCVCDSETDASDRAEPGLFGNYELLGPGLEGGMGVVYQVRDLRLNRLAALKTIRTSYLSTSDEVQRFRAESEAVASLDHPNIVPVFEVGEWEGRHYFTMKWMEGGSLVQRQADPRFHLSPREAGSLIAVLARAAHHAHQRGIIHRDLKPSNVLFDAGGRPHLADFGLAKRMDGSLDLTLSHQALGTPAYMAPEQAAGRARDVTVAADVHSLGAMLYELITGRPPFTGETPLEILRQVLEADPLPFSALIRPRPPGDSGEPGRQSAGPRRIQPVDRELEAICLKCLEKDPADRYHSAELLAEDLERWLEHRPISARPPSSWDRLWKWSRRRPAVAALSGAMTLLAVVAAACVVYQWRQTERARQLSVANLEHAFEAVDKHLAILVNHPELQSPNYHQVRVDLLGSVADTLATFARRPDADQKVNLRRGRSWRKIAALQLSLGLGLEALTNVNQSVRVFKELAGSGLSPDLVQRELAESLTMQAGMQFLFAQWNAARESYLEVIAIHQRLATPGRASPEDRLTWVESRLGFASFLNETGLFQEWPDTEDPRALCEKAVTDLRAWRSAQPGLMDYSRKLSDALVLGDAVLARSGADLDVRLARLEESLALARALNSNSVTPATDRALLARACSRLAESQREAGILEPGESLLREAVALWDGLIAEQRHKWEYHAGRTLALHRLSRLFASARRWEESEGTFHDGVGLYERHLARFPFDIVTRSSLCGFYEERAQDLRAGGWHEGALDILTRSLREREEAVKYQPRFKATLMQLAAAGRQWSAAARQTGRTQEAWDAARRALQIYETLIQESPGDRRLTEVLRVARRELRSGADGNRE